MSQMTVLVGAQWGDEGKGKWVDALARDCDVIARYQGGNNAGHTLYVRGQKVVLHQLPSGIFQSGKIAALLPSVVVNPIELAREIERVGAMTPVSSENFWISAKAHVISPFHVFLDGQKEAAATNPIGTTKRGIGPTYSEKVNRTGLRMGIYIDTARRHEWIANTLRANPSWEEAFAQKELWAEFDAAAERLQAFVCDAEARTRRALHDGKRLLLEGAQGTLLDIDHGTYPYVTSSSTIAAGAICSLGIDPRRVTHIFGVAKAYVTRVGGGSMPSEIHDSVGKFIAEKGSEFGATTGRPRRCGWFDAVAMRYAAAVNGLDGLYLNKIDILSGIAELKIATAYEHPRLGRLGEFPADHRVLAECQPVLESYPGWQGEIPKTGHWLDLPHEARDYLTALERVSGLPVLSIGTGPNREDFVSRA